MTKVSKRGFDEKDRRWFCDKELIRLKKAKEEIEWLINRDYKIDSVVTFVGDRYQFAIRQRDALKRAICSEEKLNIRKSKRLDISQISGGEVYIDGFNIIITLEVLLSGGSLIIGSDDNVRDLAGLRGTYKIIDKTEEALRLIGNFLDRYNCKFAKFYLDAPVSNSGNLRYKIMESFKEFNVDVQVELINNADVILEKLGRVVSSDAYVIDKCSSYFNIAKSIVDEYVGSSNIIDLR